MKLCLGSADKITTIIRYRHRRTPLVIQSVSCFLRLFIRCIMCRAGEMSRPLAVIAVARPAGWCAQRSLFVFMLTAPVSCLQQLSCVSSPAHNYQPSVSGRKFADAHAVPLLHCCTSKSSSPAAVHQCDVMKTESLVSNSEHVVRRA